ncbi:MAG: EamA family transporter [Proteobacteria bacterium]|nr:EamA family transporter [Pseudomonadota bacterium]
MEYSDVAICLFSALLHAGWNAAVKASPTPSQAMTAQMVLGAIVVVPCLWWTGLPAAASWPWIAASTVTNMLTIMALLRAYELGGFGSVYPVVRAVAVLLVVPFAAVIAGDRLSLGAIGGVVIMAVALAVLAFDASRDKTVPLAALGWTLAAGFGTAVYILCDARGVRAGGSALSYGFVVSITNAAAMCWRQRAGGPPWTQIAACWRIAVPTAAAAMASYLLILWVWTHAPIAPSAALRDTSAVFAILIAVVFLKEVFTRKRIVAVILAALAVPLLRLG